MKLLKTGIIIFTFLLLSACNKNSDNPTYIMVASVSTNGNYAITTNSNYQAILWNLQNKTYQIISSDANRYSAYFIKNTDNFIYQNATSKEVYVMSVNGQTVKHFNPGFSSAGEVMTSDLKTYIASDIHWDLYKIKDNQKVLMKEGWKSPNLLDSGKLLNLTLSKNDQYLLTSGSSGTTLPLDQGYDMGGYSMLGGVILWDIDSGKPIYKYIGNEQQTFATFTPNNQYIISGDENSRLLMFSTLNNTVKTLNSFYNSGTGQNFNSTREQETNDFIGRTTSIKFIDHDHYLIIFNMDDGFMQGGFHYATLYSLSGDKAIKYLPLTLSNQSYDSYPVTQSYLRDQAMDTSPSAHVLVIAQNNLNGILVYHYDPKAQTLQQVWAPVIPSKPWWQFWGN